MRATIDILLELDLWQALATILKMACYATSLTAAGGVVFLKLFAQEISQQEIQVISRFIALIACFAILFSTIRIGVMNIMLSGDFYGITNMGMTRMILNSREGVSICLRLFGLVVIAGFCYLRSKNNTLIIAAFITAISFAVSGHASDVNNQDGGRLLSQGLLCLHLMAIAFWLGSLWPLQRITYGFDSRRIAKIVHRFGQFALIVVGLLVIAGISLFFLIIGNINLIWNSAYGELFIIKLAFVLVLLSLSAINKLWITPQLLDLEQAATKRLRTSINAEIIIAMLILLSTASLTTLTGPNDLA